MPYSDLLSDATLYFTYNNTDNYTLVTPNGNEVIELIGNTTTSPQFVSDVPTGLGVTHSARINNYATVPRQYKFRGLTTGVADSNGGVGKTYSAWIKLIPNTTLVHASTNLGSSIRCFDTQNNSGTSQRDTLQINFGTYNEKPLGGADRFIQLTTSEVSVSTSTLSGRGLFSDLKLEFNRWHHVAMTTRELDAYDLVEAVIYLDGVVADYSFVTNKALQNQNFGNFTGLSAGLFAQLWLGTSNESSVTKLISYAAFWNKPLTHEQIRQQAWYTHNNEDYQALVLAKNPTYYATFDNSDKAIDHTVLAGTSWGALNDSPAGFFINEAGPANKKAWRITSSTTQANNFSANTDIDMLTGMSNTVRSGEFSIEFWSKMSDKPSSDRFIFQFGQSATTAEMQNGYLFFRYDNNGRIQIGVSNKTGATAYTASTILGTNIGTPTSETGSQFLTLHPGLNNKNFGDNQWHHVIYTHSNTDSYNGTTGAYVGALYVDGCLAGSRAYTNTFGWLDGTGTITQFNLGNANANAAHRDNSLSEFVIYPRRLSPQEVREHFIAGKDYVSEYGAVKYYDGTWKTASAAKVWNGSAWIDWSKKYYDGTQWVNL